MRQDVIGHQVRAMKDAGLDALVSISPENFAYVTGFLSPTQPLMRWRHAMALVTADGAVALVALVSLDVELGRQQFLTAFFHLHVDVRRGTLRIQDGFDRAEVIFAR